MAIRSSTPARRVRWRGALLASAMGLAFMLIAASGSVTAAHAFVDLETVTTTADKGLADNPEYCGGEGPAGSECPLRAALESAANVEVVSADEIVVSVPEGDYLLDPKKGPLPLGNLHAKACNGHPCQVTLRGAGSGLTVLDGQQETGVLSVPAKAAATTVSGVTITHGHAKYGSGILAESPLTVTNSLVTGNTGASEGGGIAALAQLTVIDSVFSANSADEGGGIWYAGTVPLLVEGTTMTGNEAISSGGGAIVAGGSSVVNVVDSTLVGNSTGGAGGAIELAGTGSVRFSTIAENTAKQGGGTFNGHLTIEGSILAGNTPNQCEQPMSAEALGANIVYGPSCVFTLGTPPIAADPRLGPLSANGGLGQTMPLLRGSPAFEGAGGGCPGADIAGAPIDGRGIARPVGAACDIGAYESTADAAAELSASPDPVTVGATLAITAKARNAGREALTGVTLTVPVPAHSTFVSAPAGCNAAFAATVTVTCAVGTLAPGQSTSVTITVRPEAPGALLETASVTTGQPDVIPANDTVTIASVATAATGPGTHAALRYSLLARALTVDRHGVITLRIRCEESPTGSCGEEIAVYSAAGTLPAAAARSRKARLLGHVHAVVAAGHTAVVHLRMSSAGRALIRSHRRLSLRLLISTGAAGSKAYSVTVRRAARS